jgi:hypothetical protein
MAKFTRHDPQNKKQDKHKHQTLDVQHVPPKKANVINRNIMKKMNEELQANSD